MEEFPHFSVYRDMGYGYPYPSTRGGFATRYPDDLRPECRIPGCPSRDGVTAGSPNDRACTRHKATPQRGFGKKR